MKAVDEPMRAVIHIQNTAPAPPAEMAATTPIRLPMPTRVAVDTIRAWTPEMALPSRLVRFSAVTRSISGNRRTGRNLVRKVKKRPVGISSSTSRDTPSVPPPGRGRTNRSPHSSLYTASMALTMRSMAGPPWVGRAGARPKKSPKLHCFKV